MQVQYTNYTRRHPSGCDAETCPCRGDATGYDGTVIRVCLDHKRYNALRAEETAAFTREREMDLRRYALPIEDAIGNANPLLLQRLIAFLVGEYLRWLGHSQEARIVPLLKRHGIKFNFAALSKSEEVWLESYNSLAKVSTQTLMAFVAEYLVMRETNSKVESAAHKMTYGYGDDSETVKVPLLDFLLRACPKMESGQGEQLALPGTTSDTEEAA